jgi:hypothetical protein
MSDDEVYYALFPQQAQKEASYESIDYAYVHKELQKSGVTLQLFIALNIQQTFNTDALVAESAQGPSWIKLCITHTQ